MDDKLPYARVRARARARKKIFRLIGSHSVKTVNFFDFTAAWLTRFTDVMQSDQQHFKRFFHGMLAEGVYLTPSAFEADARGSVEINTTLKVFAGLQAGSATNHQLC